jgi:hypothetical protein
MYFDICHFQVDEEPVFEGGKERLDIRPVICILSGCDRYIDVSEMMHMDERGAVYS